MINFYNKNPFYAFTFLKILKNNSIDYLPSYRHLKCKYFNTPRLLIQIHLGRCLAMRSNALTFVL